MPILWRNKKVHAHVLAMVVKVTVRYFPPFRTGPVVTLHCGGLVAVSHDLSHHKQIQLIMVHLSKGGSEGLVVFNWKEHGAGCLFRSKVIATAPANELLHQIALLVIQFPHVTSHTSDRSPIARLAETVVHCLGGVFFTVTVFWFSISSLVVIFYPKTMIIV